MKHILITDIQNRKTFDIVSILKYSFKNEHFILAGESGELFCKLCYGKADFVTLRTEKVEIVLMLILELCWKNIEEKRLSIYL